MDARAIRERLLAEAATWPGVQARTHRFGGASILVGAREIGRVHADLVVDVDFPQAVRDELVGAGLAQPHSLFPRSGWVSRPVRSEADLDAALALLRRRLEMARAPR